MRFGFLASHRGSNMQAVIDACNRGYLKAAPGVVISNNSQSGALNRAKQESIPGYHLSSKTHPNPDQLDSAILKALVKHNTDLVILAGYMKKLGKQTLEHFTGRILNIHPALLPKYGGKGMYGMHVHEAVIQAGEKQSGVTIHIVNDEYDTGPIIAQSQVPVLAGDTPQSLAERILAREHQFLVETLKRIVEGDVKLPAENR